MTISVKKSRFYQRFRGVGMLLKCMLILALALLACNVLLGYHSIHPRRSVNILDYFPEAGGDGSRLTWAHSTNSKSSLEEALLSKVMVLEADVSLSPVRELKEPIMAHPPNTKSDLTLDQWLSQVKRHKKAIKLNFKHLSVIDSSISVIEKHMKEINSPLVLSADIMQGPTNPISLPIDASTFLQLGHSLPSSVLSLGWTTFLDPSFPHPTYTRTMIKEMISVLGKADVTQSITFSIRACIAKNSINQLNYLLQSVPRSTLTVWSSHGDPITPHDLIIFRRHFETHKVYYDLSSPLREEFLQSISRHELPR